MGSVPSLSWLFDHPGPNRESRTQIESCNPVTPSGPVQLDRQPDVEEILLLADEFKIDELVALSLVQRGYDQIGEVSASAGGGLLVEDRANALQTLLAIVEGLAEGGDGPAWAAPSEKAYVRAQLEASSAGQSLGGVILRRLASPAVTPPGESGRLSTLINGACQVVDRAAAAAQEELLLCQCLLLALAPGAGGVPPPADFLPPLLDLLRGSTESSARAHSFVPLLLCTLQALLSVLDDPSGSGAALHKLRRERQLDAAVAALPEPACSGVKLAWALLVAGEKEPKGTGSLRNTWQAAMASGGLDFLRRGVLCSPVLRDGPPRLAAVAAQLVHQLACCLLGSPEGQEMLTALTQTSLANSPAEFGGEPAVTPAAGALVAVAGLTGERPAVPGPLRPDDLASLLNLLGETLRAAPELFLDEELRQEEFVDFMGGYVTQSQILARVPSVFVAYHGVLGALAASSDGARAIFTQLDAEHSNGVVGWRQIFDGLVQVVRRYAPATQQGVPSGTPKAAEDELPPWDSAGLCAQVDLFSTVMRHGAASEVAGWVVQLGDELGLGPVWEVLIQCMCCPVPQELKAALNNALAALARLQEVAPFVLALLLPAVVPSVRSPSSHTGLPHYDMGYQLNEIEARAERYDETIAFVGLINVLWRTLGTLGPVAGPGLDQVTEFVITTVLTTVFQRSYRVEEQKWLLADAGLQHAALVLEQGGTEHGAGAAQKILNDLAGERGIYRTVWGVLGDGVRGLVTARSRPHGLAREGATLGALRLVASALALGGAAGGVADTLLRHGRSRLPALLGLVAYPLCPRVAGAAVEASAALAALRPSLASALLATRTRGAGGVGVAAELQDAWAAGLRGGVAAPPVPPPRGREEEGAGPAAPPLDLAILDMLLDNVAGPYPTLTTLLCGLVDDAGLPVDGGAPRRAANVLDALLDVLADPQLADERPGTYEKTLALLHALLGAREVRAAVLDALLDAAPALAQAAAHVAGRGAPATPAALAQRAWALLLIADLAHAAEPAVPRHRDALRLLLDALLGGAESVALEVLETLDQDPVPPASAIADATPKLQHVVQALGLASVLGAAPCHPALEGLAAEVAGDTGAVVIDLYALKAELMQRFDGAVAAAASSVEETREAFQLALRHAQLRNEWAEDASARAFLAGAWRDAVVVAVTRRLDLAAESAEEAGPLLARLLDAALATVARLADHGAAQAAASLAHAASAAAVTLVECVRGAGTVPGPALPPPLALQATLATLLRAVGTAHAAPGVRTPLWTTLASLLALLATPEELCAPPAVLQALVDGEDAAAAGLLAEVDTLYGEPSEVMLSTLRAARPTLARLAGDAVSSDPVQASTALSLLSTIVRTDDTGTVAEAVHAQGLPQSLLQGLAALPHAVVLEASNPAGVVAEAALNLLLALALAGAGPEARAAAAERLLALQALPSLAQCEALATHPETLEESLRTRLHGLLAPALRLVLAVATGLPQSPAARGAVLAFARRLSPVLVRLVRDAAREGGRRRGVGPRELDLAALVVSLLGWVPDAAAQDAALQGAVYRLASRFLCTDEASESAAVARLQALRESGAEPEEEALLDAKILGLRCTLAQYLHQVAGGQATPPLRMPIRAGPEGLVAGPSLALVKDALLQAVTGDIPEALTSSLLAGRGDGAGAAEVGAALRTLGRLHRLTFLVEHLLGVLLAQLRSRATGGEGADPGLAQLGRSLEPLLQQLDQAASGSLAPPHRLQGLRLLVRRVKEVTAPA